MRVSPRLVGLCALLFPVILTLRLFPFGVSPLPFLFSVSGGMIRDSADRKYRVYFNDAGGAHSGNFWTWVVKDYLLFRTVVAAGYSSAETRYSSLAVQSDQNGSYVEFVVGRYGSALTQARLPRR